jgi:hypothetical protein
MDPVPRATDEPSRAADEAHTVRVRAAVPKRALNEPRVERIVYERLPLEGEIRAATRTSQSKSQLARMPSSIRATKCPLLQAFNDCAVFGAASTTQMSYRNRETGHQTTSRFYVICFSDRKLRRQNGAPQGSALRKCFSLRRAHKFSIA